MNKEEFLKDVYLEHIVKKLGYYRGLDPAIAPDTLYTSITPLIYTRGWHFHRVTPKWCGQEVAHLSDVSCKSWTFPWRKVRCFTVKDDKDDVVVERKSHRPGKCPYCKYEVYLT